jgi:PKD repeat protein
MNHLKKTALLLVLLIGVYSLMHAAPIAASCTPLTLNYCCGFGITNVALGNINNSSNDGADGYSDFTAMTISVLEGQTYTLSLQTSAASTQNYAAWIDFNNDGVFDDVTERVFTATSELNTSGTITIPTGAVLNTDLRLRIASDFDLSAAPSPCTDPDRGQVEDYTIVIAANPNPPIAGFSASDTLVCDGDVCFTDESLNVPTSWLWYFGDGNTSFQQNPCHTYASDGDYTVALIATNANGSDADTITDYITVNSLGQATVASCFPQTTSYCCGYGISQVVFANINNSTTDGDEGYQDFSCAVSTIVNEGFAYLLTTNTGVSNPQDTRAWIDYNNDGIFNNINELVMDAPNSFNPDQNIIIPIGATLNTPLRLRISSDIVGVAQSACDDNDRGQTEDYSIVIQEANSVTEVKAIANRFMVFPNPVKDLLKIKNLTKNIAVVSIELFNGVGQLVLKQNNINSALVTINVGGLDQGFYYLKIRTEQYEVTKKIMID